MAAEENLTAERPVDEAVVVDMEQLLEEHRRRQMLEHLTGPIISVILHMIVLTIAFFFLVNPEQTEVPEIEVTIREVKVKEIDKKVIEQREDIERKFDDTVPVVDKPTISGDTVDGDGGDDGGATADFSDGAASVDTGTDVLSVLEIRAGQTPLKISGLYGGRTNAGRKGIGGKRGMTQVTESAVLKALRWLKEHQSPDGSWSTSSPVAMSGLALLAFLAHGEVPDAEHEEFGATVQKGMQYLADKMINSSGMVEREYSHGIATYALAEAYGMTKIPYLKPAMEKGLRTIIDGQQFTGGWDYGFKKGERWDLSVAGWQIQALKAGFIAGADVPELVPAIEKSISWLKKENFSGGFRYAPGSGSSPSCQGIGALCLQLVGEAASPEVKAAVNFINQNVTVTYNKDVTSFVPYGWYYQTQAVFHDVQGWKKWNAQFSNELTRAQKPDGHWETANGGEYDPYMTTAFCCLMLEVYYRYLPTFKMDLHSKPVAAGPTLDVGETKSQELKTE